MLNGCGWCRSTHIADAACSCEKPCTAGWCPAICDDDEKNPVARVGEAGGGEILTLRHL